MTEVNIQFGHEFDDLLNVSGAAADLWLRRISRFGPFLVLLWVAFTRPAAPSDKGLLVVGTRPKHLGGVFRLGDMMMHWHHDWRSVQVVWLQSSRQKAWLRGFRLPGNVARVDRTNLDQLGEGIE